MNVLVSSMHLFEDVFLGGFECSCQKLEDGTRLDLAEATRHRELARLDYARLREVGMSACRDGVSWVLSRGEDFTHALPLVRAARETGVEVVWDLMHFGWPDDVDLFSPSFPGGFARHARAFARFLADELDRSPMIAPINEMSFLAWAGGDVRVMNPFQAARGVELKVQLARATIEAIDEIVAALPGARFLQPEPIIRIHPDPAHPKTHRRVEADDLLQFQAWDMLRGDVWPALGGHPRYLDVIGVNIYPDNQFMLDGSTVWPSDERYVPLSSLLMDVWRRYRRPMIISETGSEGPSRAAWLRYVCEQCEIAMREGCELEAITLYPIVNHPGWVDGRHCHNGLWDYADDRGHREAYAPLLDEIHRWRGPLLTARAKGADGSSAAPPRALHPPAQEMGLAHAALRRVRLRALVRVSLDHRLGGGHRGRAALGRARAAPRPPDRARRGRRARARGSSRCSARSSSRCTRSSSCA